MTLLSICYLLVTAEFLNLKYLSLYNELDDDLFDEEFLEVLLIIKKIIKEFACISNFIELEIFGDSNHYSNNRIFVGNYYYKFFSELYLYLFHLFIFVFFQLDPFVWNIVKCDSDSSSKPFKCRDDQIFYVCFQIGVLLTSYSDEFYGYEY
jgi:hypothetical protein